MADLMTKQKILDKSTEVICSIGIAQTTMNILAEEIGLSRRTLYRYFDSKEDIAYAVMLSIMKAWNETQTHTYDTLKGTGLMKLEQHLMILLNYMEENLSIMRFMADYDNYFRDAVDFKPKAEVDEALHTSFHLSDVLLEKLINEGIEDGSIVLQQNKETVVATITNVLWVFGQAVAVRGKKMGDDAGIDASELIRCQIQLYIDAFGLNR